jgi:hypothetical protein
MFLAIFAVLSAGTLAAIFYLIGYIKRLLKVSTSIQKSAHGIDVSLKMQAFNDMPIVKEHLESLNNPAPSRPTAPTNLSYGKQDPKLPLSEPVPGSIGLQ